MTITRKNNAEGGTNGVAITSVNVATVTGGASGDAFQVASSPSGSIIFDSASAVHGSLGYKFTPASGQQCLMRWTGLSDTSGVLRMYVTIDTLPASGVEAIFSFNTSGGGGIGALAVTAAGKYVLLDSTGSAIVASLTTASCAAGDRVELWIIAGTTSVNGQYSFALYRGDATSATETKTGTASNFNNSGVNLILDRAIAGKSSNSGWTGVIHLDDIAVASGTTTFFGVPAALPTAAFTYIRAGLGLTVNASTSSATAPATSITSYDIDWGDSTTHGTTATPAKHRYATAGPYTVVVTVTDNLGGVSSTSQSVTIEAPSTTVRVERITLGTGWTASTADALTCISDGDPTTLITSTSNPTALPFNFVLKALIPVATGQPLLVFVTSDALLSTSATFNATLWEWETTTQRSSVTGQVIPSGSGSSVGSTVVFAFPYTDLSAVTTGGWDSLEVRSSGTAA